jgi:hypothetical protein
MASRFSRFLAVFFACVVGAAPLCAQESQPTHPSDLHAWAKFGVGSWKQVRTFRESLNEQGRVSSMSIIDTKSTLVEVTETDYTLKVETTVEVAGKKFVAVPNYVKQGYNGESNGQTVEVKAMGPGEVVIDGRKYASEIRQVIINGDELKRVSLVHYNPSISPHVLRAETKATDAAGTTKNFESLVEVVAVDMPSRILTESKTVSHVKTTHRHVNGNSTVVMETQCADVPGGVVSHSSKELNAAGRVISRETLELTEYHAVREGSSDGSASPTARRRVLNSTNRTRTGG